MCGCVTTDLQSNCNGGGMCIGEPDKTGRCQCKAGYEDDNALGCRFKQATLPNENPTVAPTIAPTTTSSGAVVTESEIIIPRKEVFLKKNRILKTKF